MGFDDGLVYCITESQLQITLGCDGPGVIQSANVYLVSEPNCHAGWTICPRERIADCRMASLIESYSTRPRLRQS